ncbi:MAG: hypothetical protein ACTSU3_00375 [Candidatus Thorarchaeota archaeon]
MSENEPCEKVIFDPTRGKLVIDPRAVLRHPVRFLRASGAFLTAHHPFCDEYDGHTFTLKGRKWCIGCFFNSLSFFPTFFIMLLLWLFEPAYFVARDLFWAGIIGVVVSLLMSASGATSNKKIKAISKLILGSAFAFICFSILIIGGEIFLQFDQKVLTILVIYIPVITLLNAKRGWEIEKDCKACDHKMRWSRCPGFKDIVCKYIDEGFVVPEPTKENVD